MKLTWKDIEAHQASLTGVEWCRLSGYLGADQGIAQIAQQAGILREGGRRLSYTTVSDSLGRGALKLLASLLQEKLTWRDLEAYRSVVTPLQWQRIQGYLYERKSLQRIARLEGRPPGYTLRLSMGRGSLSLLQALLGRAPRLHPQGIVREVTPAPHAIEGSRPVLFDGEPSAGPQDLTEEARKVSPSTAPPSRRNRSRRRIKRTSHPEKRYSTPFGLTSLPVEGSLPDAPRDEGELAQALRAALKAGSAAQRADALSSGDGVDGVEKSNALIKE